MSADAKVINFPKPVPASRDIDERLKEIGRICFGVRYPGDAK